MVFIPLQHLAILVVSHRDIETHGGKIKAKSGRGGDWQRQAAASGGVVNCF
jgi:hypothetical protein